MAIVCGGGNICCERTESNRIDCLQHPCYELQNRCNAREAASYFNAGTRRTYSFSVTLHVIHRGMCSRPSSLKRFTIPSPSFLLQSWKLQPSWWFFYIRSCTSNVTQELAHAIQVSQRHGPPYSVDQLPGNSQGPRGDPPMRSAPSALQVMLAPDGGDARFHDVGMTCVHWGEGRRE